MNYVRDYLPLQQGLRREQLGLECRRRHGQRLSSTTTRIKTPSVSVSTLRSPSVRDYLPLQQGLRLIICFHNANVFIRSETIFHYNKD